MHLPTKHQTFSVVTTTRDVQRLIHHIHVVDVWRYKRSIPKFFLQNIFSNALIIFRMNYFVFFFFFLLWFRNFVIHMLAWVFFVLSSLIIIFIISVDLIFPFAWTKLSKVHWIWFGSFYLNYINDEQEEFRFAFVS